MEDETEMQELIERLDAGEPAKPDREEARATLKRFVALLETGAIRAASRAEDGSWKVYPWVKRGILLCFRLGELADFSINTTFQFSDKDLLPPQDLAARRHRPRVVPGGTTVRAGAYLGAQVVVMPPSFVNVGAYVDDATMIDSHVLVGSCAQIGKRVHLSAGAMIGGVLEPAGAMPVIVEDDAFIGAQCGVYEGARIGPGAVLAAGVVLTRGTPVFDVVREQVYRADQGGLLIIPDRAVVVPGARPAGGAFARRHGLSFQTPVVVRYREAGENARLALESALRA